MILIRKNGRESKLPGRARLRIKLITGQMILPMRGSPPKKGKRRKIRMNKPY